MVSYPNDSILRLAGGRLMEARRAELERMVSGPHRLEPVAVVNDVQYVNDSRSTFLDAALDAIAFLPQKLVWIVGTWSDDMSEGRVQELLRDRVHTVIHFGPLPKAARLPDDVYLANDLRTAVFLARELALPGQTVLFSPACPSGNGFANYEERGAEFKRAVKQL